LYIWNSPSPAENCNVCNHYPHWDSYFWGTPIFETHPNHVKLPPGGFQPFP
jgi:hypothetical protein